MFLVGPLLNNQSRDNTHVEGFLSRVGDLQTSHLEPIAIEPGRVIYGEKGSSFIFNESRMSLPVVFLPEVGEFGLWVNVEEGWLHMCERNNSPGPGNENFCIAILIGWSCGCKHRSVLPTLVNSNSVIGRGIAVVLHVLRSVMDSDGGNQSLRIEAVTVKPCWTFQVGSFAENVEVVVEDGSASEVELRDWHNCVLTEFRDPLIFIFLSIACYRSCAEQSLCRGVTTR
jgi:hypothetical protein